MLAKFEQFIKKRRFVTNVSESTVEWYRQSLCWLDSETPTDDDIKSLIMRMREKGLKVTSVNCRLRCIKAYCRWAGLPTAVPRLKEEQRQLPVFDVNDVLKLLRWKPKTMPQHRLQTMIAALADTGPRIDEVLSLRWDDCDFDNLLLTLHGKGRKDRKVPMSLELRKRLVLFQRQSDSKAGLVFSTRGGTKQGRRNVLRDVKNLCRSLGFEPPERSIHAMRHTFSVNYLRKGGSVFHLQKMLGHSSLEMTRRYANLMTEDLRLSLLG